MDGSHTRTAHIRTRVATLALYGNKRDQSGSSPLPMYDPFLNNAV